MSDIKRELSCQSTKVDRKIKTWTYTYLYIGVGKNFVTIIIIYHTQSYKKYEENGNFNSAGLGKYGLYMTLVDEFNILSRENKMSLKLQQQYKFFEQKHRNKVGDWEGHSILPYENMN